MLNLHPPTAGTLAQLVEQRTENPCVPGSIPGGTTIQQKTQLTCWVFCWIETFIIIAKKKRPMSAFLHLLKCVEKDQ